MVPFGDFMSCAESSRAGLQALGRQAGVCLIAAAVICLGPQPATRAETRTIRAVSLGPGDLGAVDAARRLNAARDSGVDTIFVPVSIHGAAPDETIATLIRDAHARGLRVHAAVPIMSAAPAEALPLSREHVIYRHPEWLMVPRELAIDVEGIDPRSPDYLGRLVRWTRAHSDPIEDLYLSPLLPEASAFIADAVRRLVARHAFDGVHFEALRFPATTFDYSVRALEAFRGAMHGALPSSERIRIDEVERLDPFGYPNELPDEWRRFRLTRLTSLVAQLRSAVRSVRPGAIVSASAVPGAEHALRDYLQDWRTWADNGFVDALSGPPAATTTLLFSYEALVEPAAADPAAPPAVPSP